MPFKSEAQRRYFEANKSKLEKQGVDVEEWEQASKGMKLPERAPKKATKEEGSHRVNASASIWSKYPASSRSMSLNSSVRSPMSMTFARLDMAQKLHTVIIRNSIRATAPSFIQTASLVCSRSRATGPASPVTEVVQLCGFPSVRATKMVTISVHAESETIVEFLQNPNRIGRAPGILCWSGE